MRIALDSSVLIGAHISLAGVCSELLEDLLMHHELVTSDFILHEVARNLSDKFHFPKQTAEKAAAFLRRAGVVVVPADMPIDACRDPRDLPILGTAVAGECSLLISVDRDLLDMQRIYEIPIIRPGEYWRQTT